MGFFFDSNKIFLPQSQNGYFFDSNKIFLPQSQNGYFRNNKRNGFGRISKWVCNESKHDMLAYQGKTNKKSHYFPDNLQAFWCSYEQCCYQVDGVNNVNVECKPIFQARQLLFFQIGVGLSDQFGEVRHDNLEFNQTNGNFTHNMLHDSFWY